MRDRSRSFGDFRMRQRGDRLHGVERQIVERREPIQERVHADRDLREIFRQDPQTARPREDRDFLRRELRRHQAAQTSLKSRSQFPPRIFAMSSSLYPRATRPRVTLGHSEMLLKPSAAMVSHRKPLGYQRLVVVSHESLVNDSKMSEPTATWSMPMRSTA